MTLQKVEKAVVNLVGALIDDDYSNGSNAVVLFIMPRYPRDLHAALKVGLDFGSRMQIGLDVVELPAQSGATAQRYQTEECPGELRGVT